MRDDVLAPDAMPRSMYDRSVLRIPLWKSRRGPFETCAAARCCDTCKHRQLIDNGAATHAPSCARALPDVSICATCQR
jgi:hypothetical protein